MKYRIILFSILLLSISATHSKSITAIIKGFSGDVTILRLNGKPRNINPKLDIQLENDDIIITGMNGSLELKFQGAKNIFLCKPNQIYSIGSFSKYLQGNKKYKRLTVHSENVISIDPPKHLKSIK